mmetsp:Transcript_47163/g.81124  ORF Transcript_47163/g.81124 Transcript_47163/m.81124 type:complete len:311 (-) Transcript_47163:227-1159(-)
MLCGKVVVFPVGLLGAGLHHDGRVQVVVQVRGQEAVRQVRVLGQDVRRQVVVLVLAVQEQQVPEGLRREGRAAQQEVQLAEARGRVLVHVHQRLVVQGDGVQLLLGARGHVAQRLARGVQVAQRVLHRRLEVEGLHQAGLAQHGRVAHRTHLNAVRVRAHAQLGVLPYAPLHDLRNLLEGGAVLLLAVVAEGDVVRQVRPVAQRGHRLLVLGHGLVVLLLLVQDGRLADHRVRVVRQALVQQPLAGRELVLLVLDGRLQRQHALAVLRRVLHAPGCAERLRVHARLLKRLSVVDFVFLNSWADFNQLFIH